MERRKIPILQIIPSGCALASALYVTSICICNGICVQLCICVLSWFYLGFILYHPNNLQWMGTTLNFEELFYLES